MDSAHMASLFPEALLSATDAVLAAFEADLARLDDPRDAEVLGAVERVVLALNRVNDAHHGAAYETAEREDLCQYLDDSLEEHGIDVPALTARHGLGPGELTDRWRDW
ncbi:hypothetical protein [Streptacidiphilus sp. PB12-B1b]|uniref:hypothetical protein n=1 Tax=Streptacidiphilus sp. PB12-B1b TaxID=2705012 RepID=UPI001CDC4653|nr:hypothetical protein [Streptacidiphilus sp. PB12-B1b]